MRCDDFHPISAGDLALLAEVFERHGGAFRVQCGLRHRSIEVRLDLPADEYREKQCRELAQTQHLRLHQEATSSGR
jgi:hypothetical protein